MTIWFVSRHPGAMVWLKSQSIAVDRFETHLDPANVSEGDIVYGNLPVNLACQLIEQGARYMHLSLQLPKDLRGQELTAAQLVDCGAQFSEYRITCLGQFSEKFDG
jgi:CRISPR-associated protein Csx16